MDNLMKDYIEYDSDADPNGARGIAIADALLRRYDGDIGKMAIAIKMARLENAFDGIETGRHLKN